MEFEGLEVGVFKAPPCKSCPRPQPHCSQGFALMRPTTPPLQGRVIIPGGSRLKRVFKGGLTPMCLFSSSSCFLFKYRLNLGGVRSLLGVSLAILCKLLNVQVKINARIFLNFRA